MACVIYPNTSFSQTVTASGAAFSEVSAGGGTISGWGTTANTATQNDIYNTLLLVAKSKTTFYFKAQNFNFSSIPAGSTIDGIVVEIDKFYNGPAAVTDNSVRIIKPDGSLGATEKSTGASWGNADTDTYDSYGGAADLWGETWTVADIQDPDFGFAISANTGGTNGNYNMYIDHIKITVYFTPPFDITSTVSAGAGAEPTTISSTVDTDAERIQVFDFTLTDVGAPGDNLATIIDQIQITQGTGNDVANWTDAIAAAKLYGPDLGESTGSELSGTVGATTITFMLNDMISVANGSNETYKLRIYLNTDLSNCNEGDNLVFKLDYSNITEDINGSQFVSGSPESGNTNVGIDIVATKLVFETNMPPSSNVGVNTNFNVTVHAVDDNGNIDLDANHTVTLALNSGGGTLSSASGLTQNLSSGTYAWTDVQYSISGTFEIEAQNGLLTNALTGIIDTEFGSFKFTIKTDNPGVTNSTSFRLYVFTAGYTFNYDVDWEDDGIWDDFGITTSTTDHDYGVAGTYTIAIRGTFPNIYFNTSNDYLKVLSVEQWGDIAWESFTRAFYGCSNLVINATDAPDLTNAGDMSYIFTGCSSITTGNFGAWDISNITGTTRAFQGCTNFNEDISGWDFSSVQMSPYMFKDCSSFDQDLSGWDFSSIIFSSSLIEFVQNSGLSVTNYDNLIIGWYNQRASMPLNLDLGSAAPGGVFDLHYCVAQPERAALIAAPYNWTFMGDTYDCSTLPIDLVKFDAFAEDSQVKLEWTTASEFNSDYFIIERSFSTDGDFEPIGFVDAAGNSNIKIDYTFIDKYPQDINYYRLKQVDFNGEFTYYGPVFIDKSMNTNNFSLNIYPNPAQDILHVNNSENILTISIYSIDGRFIKNCAVGEKIDISDLEMGSYIIKATDEKMNQTTKYFIKQ